MNKTLRIGVMAGLQVIFIIVNALPAEKLFFGAASGVTARYYLPALAAEERGFWKQQGLEVEWVPYRGTALMYRATAAGQTQLGMDMVLPAIVAIARGLPMVMAANMSTSMTAGLWVLTKSPIRDVQELAGKKVAISRMGSFAHAVAMAVLRAHGLEGKVKLVGAGATPEMLAALKAQAVDASTHTLDSIFVLKWKGEVRMLTQIPGRIWEEELGSILFAHRDFLQRNPETVRKAIPAVINSMDYVRSNRDWTIRKIQAEQGLPADGASALIEGLKWSTDGKVRKGALEEAINFAVEFNMIKREERPSVEKVYAGAFVGQP